MSDMQPENTNPATATAAPSAPAEAKPKKRLSSGPFGGEGIPFGSNEMRLTGLQWLATIIISAAILWMLPKVWRAVEPLKLGPNARVQNELALGDYWHIQRCFKEMLKDTDNVVLGDSVMWGFRVTPENALSTQLSQRTGAAKFANLGIAGCHPVANYGLMYYYGADLHDKNVVLGFNALWVSTPREDLSLDDKDAVSGIKHPKLLPLSERLASDKSKMDDRLGIAIKHRFEIYDWVTHMQNAGFDGADIPTWTIEHPYSLPKIKIYPDLSEDDNPANIKAWNSKGSKPQPYAFVPLDQSNQWRYFKKLVELLQQRGNKVYVLVLPVNEHQMEPKTLARYQKELKPGIEGWLKAQKIPYLAPEALPTELYADFSHPILNGYGLIADKLVADPAFQKMFVKK